jgi:uncharacterized RDD family membrane protein YckC
MVMNESESNVPLRYAGFWIRFVALLIDGIVLNVLYAIVSIFIEFNIIQKNIGLPQSNEQNAFHLGDVLSAELFSDLMTLAAVNFVIYSAYYVLMTSQFGQTLGKMVCGITVVQASGEKAGFKHVLLREIPGKIISSLILNIGYVMAAFDDQKRSLHDRMAKTVVVWKSK